MSTEAFEMRGRARELRAMAARLDELADELEHKHANGRRLLGGRELGDAAYRMMSLALAAAGDREVHYKDLAARIERRERALIKGRDGAMTLLVQLGRDARFESVGRRSGRWRLAASS